jgi:hypothetical protein
MRNAVLVQALVDVQEVSPHPGIALDVDANIDIRPAVIVDIYYRYPPAPFSLATNPGDIGNVFENKIPFIQVKFVGYGIAGEIDVRLAIPVEIANPYTASIVNIDIVKNVDTVVLYDLIIEVNA